MLSPRSAVDSSSTRLTRCFKAVFPELPPEELVNATTASVKNWDSVASVTLFTLIEEEFSIVFDLDELERLDSFEHILTKLKQNHGS